MCSFFPYVTALDLQPYIKSKFRPSILQLWARAYQYMFTNWYKHEELCQRKKNDEFKRIIAEKDAEIKKKFNEKYIQI